MNGMRLNLFRKLPKDIIVSDEQRNNKIQQKKIKIQYFHIINYKCYMYRIDLNSSCSLKKKVKLAKYEIYLH